MIGLSEWLRKYSQSRLSERRRDMLRRVTGSMDRMVQRRQNRKPRQIRAWDFPRW